MMQGTVTFVPPDQGPASLEKPSGSSMQSGRAAVVYTSLDDIRTDNALHLPSREAPEPLLREAIDARLVELQGQTQNETPDEYYHLVAARQFLVQAQSSSQEI